FTWEMIKIRGSWVGINTNMPNRLAYEALRNDKINRLKGYDRIRREASYCERARIYILTI
ncbi:MAG: DNA/RNA nuclease SfsA, partial [Bacteroidota bacterium]